MWHKKLAADLFSQLPDKLEDTEAVMEWLQFLIEQAHKRANVMKMFSVGG